jgi:hypothetical protein
MSEQIREQISAFLDGELPGSETELLLKRLTRDAELRESFGRYALIGEAMRGMKHMPPDPRLCRRASIAPSTANPADRGRAGAHRDGPTGLVAPARGSRGRGERRGHGGRRPAAARGGAGDRPASIAAPAPVKSREAISYTVPRMQTAARADHSGRG